MRPIPFRSLLLAAAAVGLLAANETQKTYVITRYQAGVRNPEKTLVQDSHYHWKLNCAQAEADKLADAAGTRMGRTKYSVKQGRPGQLDPCRHCVKVM